MNKEIKTISQQQQSELITTLKLRFESNLHRHPKILWEDVYKRLLLNPEKLWALYNMEETNGCPDVVLYNKDTEEYTFFDCSKESPSGRRSLCYDRQALNDRKANKPKNSAIDMAKEIGIEILTKEQYFWLQQLEEFDTKTSSWVKTPDKIRQLNGALFCDYRYQTVFVYHNGADSYYGSRGFRGLLIV